MRFVYVLFILLLSLLPRECDGGHFVDVVDDVPSHNIPLMHFENGSEHGAIATHGGRGLIGQEYVLPMIQIQSDLEIGQSGWNQHRVLG